ncbi:MAG: signal peptidase I [Candidatus Thorarchaeota archaeon]
MAESYLKKVTKKRRVEKRKSSSKRKVIIAVILIIIAFSGSFLFYYILQITLNTQTPMVVVVSGSMEPNLLKGDLLFLQGKESSQIKTGTIADKQGDIIVFDARGLPGWIHPPNDPIVHRVVDKWYDGGWFFRTKGDANPIIDDAPVPESRIIGVVVGRIPYIGWVKIILTDSGLLIPLLIVVSALLIISIIWDILKKDDKLKNNKNGEKELIYDPKSKNTESINEIELDYTKKI